MSADIDPEPALYPLLLRPELHRRVWGGERLLTLYGETVPVRGKPGEPVGESWLLDAASVVTNGPLAGRSLADLAAELGSRLVGSEPFARYGPRLPLLLKLIDADQPLSVQVHPDDSYALRHEAASGHLGKSEAWYVLEATPGAAVLWGLRAPLEAAQFHQAAEQGELPGLMHTLPVAARSVVVNPAGTLHAVGAGILLFEIQQSSDLTYRIYDYDRVGADGQPRELHLAKAASVANLASTPHEQQAPIALGNGWYRLVQRPEFVLDRLVLGDQGSAASAGSVTGHVAPSSLETLTVIEGQVTLSLSAGASGAATSGIPQAAAPFESAVLGFGQTALLPAGLGRPYTLTGQGVVLRGAVVKAALEPSAS